MGDIAEEHLDRIIDHWDDEDERDVREVRCKHCGERYLWWRHVGDRWKLFNEDEEEHVCKGVPRDVANDFDVIP